LAHRFLAMFSCIKKGSGEPL
jgi:hypothetical protein